VDVVLEAKTAYDGPSNDSLVNATLQQIAGEQTYNKLSSTDQSKEKYVCSGVANTAAYFIIVGFTGDPLGCKA